MPSHVMSVPCLRVIVDDETGTQSFIDVVDTAINKHGGEPNIPQFKLVSKWIRDGYDDAQPEVFEVKISIKGPGIKSKKSLGKLLLEIKENSLELVARVNISSTPVPQFGHWLMFIDYKSENGKKWKPATVIPFFVVEGPPDEKE